MLLLKQNTTRKKRVDKNIIKLNFNIRNSQKYKVKAILNSILYKKELKINYLPKLYYLIFLISYLKKIISRS